VPSKTLVIVNPASGSGKTGRRWKKLEPTLRSRLGDVEVELTKAPRDAERIAREAARAGVDRILVVGGDGTTSEVVTGLLASDLGRYTELGLLPLGSGCDFSRTMGISRRPEVALDDLEEGERRRVDAGRIRFRDREGRECERYFLNEASFGMSGLVCDLVNRAGKSMGPTTAFALGTRRDSGG